tara:strand:+ start:391 stop:717 length:327 start_codon:yes stop_codon:yes gene_type:complete
MELINGNWEVILNSLGVVAAFFGGLKLKTINLKKANTDAVSSMQTVYDAFVIDNKERYIELREELKYLRSELKLIKEESRDLKTEVKTWKTKYNSLKKQFETYKKTHP